MTSSGPDGVFVLGGRGDGTFEEPVYYVFDEGIPTRDVAFADTSGDGIDDLVVSTSGFFGSGSSSGERFVSPGLGDGTFSEPTSYFYAGQGGPLEVGDFDESGTTDVAVSMFGFGADEPVARFYLNEWRPAGAAPLVTVTGA